MTQGSLHCLYFWHWESTYKKSSGVHQKHKDSSKKHHKTSGVGWTQPLWGPATKRINICHNVTVLLWFRSWLINLRCYVFRVILPLSFTLQLEIYIKTVLLRQGPPTLTPFILDNNDIIRNYAFYRFFLMPAKTDSPRKDSRVEKRPLCVQWTLAHLINSCIYNRAMACHGIKWTSGVALLGHQVIIHKTDFCLQKKILSLSPSSSTVMLW